jgi:hypothetical protein
MKGYNITFNNSMKDINPTIPYKDGEISIQGSEFHYCSPKDDYGPYTQVEVAVFDSKGNRVREDAIKQWAEDADDDHQPNYGFVPYGRVVELLKKDGYTDENVSGIFQRLEGKT